MVTQSAKNVIYNPSNILLEHEGLLEILSKYSNEPTYKNIDVFRTAFVHKSYCTRKNENFDNGNLSCPSDCIPLQEESNERLEFLGDAVLSLVTANYFFTRYPNENEGYLTKMRTKIVNGNMLAECCKYAGLEQYIIISKQIEENEGRTSTRILEDCFEAFVGAMYTDAQASGKNAMNTVSTWIINLLETNIDFADLILTDNNYKDKFIKYWEAVNGQPPKYYEQSVETTAKGKMFRVVVKANDDTVIQTGCGKTKKEAENNAARNALVFYGQL